MDQFIEIIKYIVLGIIQGITEIFPISSSGHVTLFSHLFKMDMSNFQTFLMITNAGSFLALLFFFRRDVGQLIKGTYCYLIRKDETAKEDFIYVLKLIIAVIPLGIFGLLIKEYLPNDLLSVGFALLITSGLLFYVYKQRDIQWKNDITWRNALIIGAFQMFAIFPGISRSGITISGGLTQKIELKKVLRFSFLSYILISVPVTLLGFYDALHAHESIHFLGYSLAFIMSFVFSLLAVRFLYNYVKVKNLIYFSVYCVIVGLLSITLHILVL
ncbi:MAG: undecaprenyl-diphosphate phosphatase [Acholeplasmataceae bacterium]|jgi:undecaprenyl-diphosphatase|nr:undecaprenyl-diphosphate phosphatase [Acholeplasmataceae bacterium]